VVQREEWTAFEDPAPRTEFLEDRSRSIIARNDSSDVGFDASINPYRGCEHGCSYCYARPTHEYLGFSAGLDFETKVLVKPEAPTLLRAELASRSWTPQVLALSGVTDPYQPAERRLRLTRQCLEVLVEARNPVAVITKNHLVTRDLDLLGELSRHEAASVAVSVTTLDRSLQKRMEPRTSIPGLRLEAIARLADAGVPVSVFVAPVIPGLTDHEIPDILKAAAAAGARRATYIMLRLPGAVATLFEEWLSIHFPQRVEKVMNRMRALHDGRLYNPRFGVRQTGEGPYAEEVARLFSLAARRSGLTGRISSLSTAAFRRPSLGPQLSLFDAPADAEVDAPADAEGAEE
jgi:DNA repair photolyase